MEYVVHSRFKKKAIGGYVNLPKYTKCEVIQNIIVHDGMPICAIESENSHQYFALNEDGKGIERGELTQYIQKRLAKNDKNHQLRWDRVWDDKLCQKYKREEHRDYWLWNNDFFKASISDLQYIANLIK